MLLWSTTEFAGSWVPVWSVMTAGEVIFAQRDIEQKGEENFVLNVPNECDAAN